MGSKAFLAGGAVTLDVDAEVGVMVPQAVASAVAVIVSELVINAAKHAFAGRERGRISVHLQGRVGSGHAVVVSDDGCGLPVGFDLTRSRGLGVRIVLAMACRIGAELEVSGAGQGTRFEVIVSG